ncbi:MAG TPA: hypothetical protein VMS21_12220, partial [Methylomirabilota bacterium]|nr:hypothetical protein [Methylomirabilota bacterium]
RSKLVSNTPEPGNDFLSSRSHFFRLAGKRFRQTVLGPQFWMKTGSVLLRERSFIHPDWWGSLLFSNTGQCLRRFRGSLLCVLGKITFVNLNERLKFLIANSAS